MWFTLVLVVLVAYGSVRSWTLRRWRRERVAAQSAQRRAMAPVVQRGAAEGRVAGAFRSAWRVRKAGHRNAAAPYRLEDFFPQR